MAEKLRARLSDKSQLAAPARNGIERADNRKDQEDCLILQLGYGNVENLRVHLAQIKIVPQIDDEPEFVRQVELAVNGILRRYSPAALALIKIDNWFGSRWLGFSGKALGALGLTLIPSKCRPDNLIIPPFVPERVVSQRRLAGAAFQEIGAGKPLHFHIRSILALRGKAAIEEPETALAWYSSNSKTNDRAALMVYVPAGDIYWPW